MLLGGEPGGGKSNALNLIVAHGALSADCKLILIDGKQVELGPWRHCADMFIGPSINDALDCMHRAPADHERPLRQAPGRRPAQDHPRSRGSRSTWSSSTSTPTSPPPSATRNSKPSSPRSPATWSPAAAPPGVIVILATQRPSHQVIDPSLRDLFGYRWAFRCTTDSSSDTVLGHGWAAEGYSAATIDPLARGVSWLLSETGVPRRIKTAYLTDRRHRRPGRLRRPAPPQGGGRMNAVTTPARQPGHAPSHARLRARTLSTARLTPKRARPVVENDAYAAFARRILRAYARRIATGDIEALTLMTGLAGDIDTAIRNAVTGLRDFGYSWAEIGSRLGVTRQAAQQRWGGRQP